MDEAEQISGEVAHSLCSRLTIYLVTQIVFFFSQKSDHKQSSSATVSVLSLSLLCVVCSCSVRYTKIYLCLWPSYFNEIKMEFSDETSNVRMWFRTCERNAVCLSCILNTLDNIDESQWNIVFSMAPQRRIRQFSFAERKNKNFTNYSPNTRLPNTALSTVVRVCNLWHPHTQYPTRVVNARTKTEQKITGIINTTKDSLKFNLILMCVKHF